MKRAKHIPFLLFLLASLMVASVALAQTMPAQTTEGRLTETEKDPPSSDAISAARSSYTPDVKGEGLSRYAGDGMTAQLSRDRLTRPVPPHHGYPRGSYRTPWMDHGDAGHAAIGAAIGFGLGAALAAKANTSPYPGATARAIFLVGGLGALMGGVIGGSHGGPFAFAHHRRTYPPARREDEESDLSAHFIGSRSEDRSSP